MLICVLLIAGAAPDPAAAESEGDPVAVTTEFGYIADGLVNASGGIRTGSAYLQNIDATVTIDLGRFVGSRSGTLFAYLLWNDASTFSDPVLG